MPQSRAYFIASLRRLGDPALQARRVSEWRVHGSCAVPTIIFADEREVLNLYD